MDYRDGRDSDMTTDTMDLLEAVALATAKDAAASAPATAEPATEAKVPTALDSKSIAPQPYALDVDHSRDSLLTDFGKETLNDAICCRGESYQDLFVRVASAYADDAAHAQRIYDYISRLWFMPATPVLSNGGTGRGPAHLLLSQLGARQPQRHRRHLERECLARLARRRHRHLLGQVRGIGEPVGPERQRPAASSPSSA